MSTSKNPWFSKPDLRKAIASVADCGLTVGRVEFRHDLILVHVERQAASPTLAGAVGVSGRRRKRSGSADDSRSAASPAA